MIGSPCIFLRLCNSSQDENLETYIKSRFNCVDIFEEYVNDLKKQHGVVRSAADDPANFDPGITVSHSSSLSLHVVQIF